MANQLKSCEKTWNLKMTQFAIKTDNPLRKIWEGHKVFPNPRKETITLQIGDPTVFGNFPMAPECVSALKNALERDNFAYTVSAGMKSARQSVAEYFNKNNLENVSADDVILTNGCSTALEISFRALANPGENILIPRPAWNYTTWICGSNIDVKFYNLDPAQAWNVDLEHLESQIDQETKAILINNPGNPCGNVFSKDHIIDILNIAERHKLPIIADEVYEHFVFPGVEYFSIASLSKNVPVLTCSGLTKRFLMPGVRMGWIILNDRNNTLDEVRLGLANIVGRNFWPNSTVQLALPDILKNTPQEFFNDNCRRIHSHTLSAFNILKDVPGLNPILPKGSMYMMICIDLPKFPKFSTCLDFTQGLTREQSVQTFPGCPCFFYPSYFRIVLTVPEKLITEACNRIKEFCETHYKSDISEKHPLLKKGTTLPLDDAPSKSFSRKRRSESGFSNKHRLC